MCLNFFKFIIIFLNLRKIYLIIAVVISGEEGLRKITLFYIANFSTFLFVLIMRMRFLTIGKISREDTIYTVYQTPMQPASFLVLWEQGRSLKHHFKLCLYWEGAL